MTTSEQDAAVARLVRARTDAKRRKILLESELQIAGEALAQIGSSLKHISGYQGAAFAAQRILPEMDMAPEICGFDKLKEMLNELIELDRRVAELNHNAAALGID